MSAALRTIDEASTPMLVALLKASAPLPPDAKTRFELLEDAASQPGDDALGLLLTAGISADIDRRGELLLQAVSEGSSTRVRMLTEHGASAKGATWNRKPLVTALVESDLLRRPGTPTLLGELQQNAIATLIDAGYDPAAPDGNGRTAIQIAGRDPDTLSALTAAIGQAGASDEPLHRAVRNDDPAALKSLLAAGSADIDNLDALGRTPLTYALQLRRHAAARVLLLAGAAITFEPRTTYQRADLDYATEPQVSTAFLIRLLQSKLLSLPPATDRAGLASFEAEYLAANAFQLPDFEWSVGADCGQMQCVGRWKGKGNVDYDFMPLRSVRGDHGSNTTYRLVQYSLRSVTSGWSWVYPDGHVVPTNAHFEVTFNVMGSMKVPGCTWDIQRPTCAPGLSITNPNVETTLQFKTDSGFESPPSDTLTVMQAGGMLVSIQPGETRVFDRSKGDLTVNLDPVNAKTFSYGVEASLLRGIAVPELVADPSLTENRAAAYVQIARRRARIRPPSGGDEDDVVNKSAAAEVMALSGRCLQADYRTIALTALRTQANVLVSLDKRVLDLRNLVIAAAALTPQEIADALARINALLADPATGSRDTLLDVQAALSDALPAAQATGSAVARMNESTLDDVSRQMEVYQALVLEYAQYVPTQSLAGTLDAGTIAAIRSRLEPHDVAVPDTALGGGGKAVRAAFGLPDPRS